MRLFLSGGGSNKQTHLLDQTFARELDKDKPLLYIPVALSVDHPLREKAKEWVQQTFRPLGISTFYFAQEENLPALAIANLHDTFSGIYIGGGNTFRLSKLLRESGLDIQIKSAVMNNLPVYGVSAGTLIFARTITQAIGYDEYVDGDLENLTGLDLLQGHDIWCHYDISMDPQIDDYRDKYNLDKLIVLPDNLGIIVNEMTMNFIGNGVGYAFQKIKSIMKNGSCLKLANY